MNFVGAIFDLDGTLLDSMGVWAQIDRDFLGRRGLAVPADYMAVIAAMSFRRAAEYTVARFHLSDTPDALMEEWSMMAQEAYAHHVLLKPGAGEYLGYLKEKGVRLAVATASEAALFIPALQRNGVFSLFDAVTTLREVRRGKGFPDIYWRAAEKLGLSPAECVVFEDMAAGISGARDGGFRTVGVYDSHSEADRDRIRAMADCYLESFTQAREILHTSGE